MKENSIEEAIERLEYIDRAYSCNNYYSIWDLKCIEILLSDYKRVLKENEILKEEKEQAWEEWNNLEQGSYETEQKLKQQIKKLQKENEELKNKIMDKELEIIGIEEYTKASMGEIIEQYYTANEDCITKQRIEDIIDRIDYDIKKTKEIISKNTNIYAGYRKNDYQIVRLRAMNTKSLDIKKRLQELLESEK